MDNDLLAYIERLELMAFFAGYPLIYALVRSIAGGQSKNSSSFANRLVRLLPFSYALAGSLFLGLILKNMYPDYSVNNIAEQFQNSYLKILGLLAILFWIPACSKKPVFSLLHSLVFFFFLLKDLLMDMISINGRGIIKNDMKIYTDSLLLNMGTLTIIFILHFIINRVFNQNKVSSN